MGDAPRTASMVVHETPRVQKRPQNVLDGFLPALGFREIAHHHGTFGIGRRLPELERNQPREKRAVDRDRLQLDAVIRTCREATTLSEAGRRLFDRSREKRSVVNDADRLRKYLLKFGLSWEQVRLGA